MVVAILGQDFKSFSWFEIRMFSHPVFVFPPCSVRIFKLLLYLGAGVFLQWEEPLHTPLLLQSGKLLPKFPSISLSMWLSLLLSSLNSRMNSQSCLTHSERFILESTCAKRVNEGFHWSLQHMTGCHISAKICAHYVCYASQSFLWFMHFWIAGLFSLCPWVKQCCNWRNFVSLFFASLLLLLLFAPRL